MGVPAAYNVLFMCAPAHNLSTTIVLSNGDNPGVAMGVASGTVMGARSYLVAAAVPADLQAVYGGAIRILGPYTNALSNGGGTVRLRNRLGAVLLEATYDDQPPYPAAADGGGHSLILARPSLGERDPRAWAASDRIGGSPGSVDPVTTHAQRTIVINEILAHTDDPQSEFIELYNYGNSIVSLAGCVVTDVGSTKRAGSLAAIAA